MSKYKLEAWLKSRGSGTPSCRYKVPLGAVNRCVEQRKIAVAKIERRLAEIHQLLSKVK